MWNSSRPKAPSEEALEHSTPEARASAGNDIATFEDLDGLSDERLREVAAECPVDTVDSLSCVPCRAYEILQEHAEEAKKAALAVLENPLGRAQAVSDQVLEDNVNPALAEKIQADLAEAIKDEKYDAILSTSEGDPSYNPLDVRATFAQQVHDLNLTVKQMLEGPPIPPPNVTMDDLAALTVGASNWVDYMKGQIAMGLTPNETVLARIQTVDAVVRRLKP